MPKDGNLYPEYVTRLYIQSSHRRPDDKTPALIIQSNPLHRRVEQVVNIHGALTDRTLQVCQLLSVQYTTLHTAIHNVSL